MMQEFTQRINDTAQEAVDAIHTAVPGKIIQYYPDKGLADVQPVMQFKKPDGELIDYPKITGVPVMLYQTYNQDAIVAMPIKPGDGGYLVVSEKSTDYWLYGQATDTDWNFDLSDAIFIPGLFNKGNPVEVEACKKEVIIIDEKGVRVTIDGKNRKIALEADGTRVTLDGKANTVTLDAKKFIINADVDLNGKEVATKDVIASGVISLTNHTHTGNLGAPTSPPLP